jgi:hypothetical protein
MGRHPALEERFGTPEAVGEAVDAWFVSLRDGYDKDDPCAVLPTYTGLGRLLGFDSAVTLWRYLNAPEGSARAEFQQPLKDAVARIEEIYESRLATGKPVGSIFALKNRGWSDQQTVTHELAGDGWGAILEGLSSRQTSQDDDAE